MVYYPKDEAKPLKPIADYLAVFPGDYQNSGKALENAILQTKAGRKFFYLINKNFFRQLTNLTR